MESLKQWAFCRILENSVSLLSETLLPSSLFTVPSPTLGVIILNIFFLLIWYAFKKQLIVFLCISLITKWGWIFSHVLCLLHFLFCESNLCGSCIFSFSFPLKTPSCGAEEREHAGRAVVMTPERWISSTGPAWQTYRVPPAKIPPTFWKPVAFVYSALN